MNKIVFGVCCIGMAFSGHVLAQGGTIEITNAQYVANGSPRQCNATSAIRTYCEGKTSCRFPVNNQLCGDPLPDTPKSLSVYYTCGDKTDSSTFAEGSEGSIRCR